MTEERVWAFKNGQKPETYKTMKRVHGVIWILAVLPFLVMLISTFADNAYRLAHGMALPLFVAASICYILWVWGGVIVRTVFSPEEVLRWCPVTRNGQLYMFDLTRTEVLEALGERPMDMDDLMPRLAILQEKIAEQGKDSALFSEEIIEQYGLHVFGIIKVRASFFGTKCVCWFGLDDNGADIRHTFRFFREKRGSEELYYMLKELSQEWKMER